MWGVVVVDPGHGRPGLHRDALGNERELVDLDFCGCRRRGLSGNSARYANKHDRKRGGDAERADGAHDRDVPLQRCSGWSMMASRCCPRLKVTSVMPRTERSLSSATFIGPGEGAAPGAGCGNAVDIAVWKVTLPSTFCMIWWM